MLLDTYKRDKVRLADSFGVAYPAWFINPAAEYQSISRYAGVIDLTHWRIFRVTGKDRVSFLNAMLTGDVAAQEANTGCHALLTTIKGKIVAELFVWMRGDDVMLQVPQGDADETLSILQKHVVMEDVIVEDVSDTHGVLALEGPKTVEILWRVFDKGPFPKEPFRAVERQFTDFKIYLTNNSVSGEAGCHMMMPLSSTECFWEYIVQAARGSDGLPVGSVAWNMRRAENGLPWYGIDFTLDNFPDESRLGHTVSYDKGCFRGQETLARLHHRGHVNRVLVGLTPTDVPSCLGPLAEEFRGEINNYDEPALKKSAPALAKTLDLTVAFPPGTELFANGNRSEKPIGHITSAVYSPRLQSPLILAYVRREIADARSEVHLQKLTLRHVDLPLAD